MTLAATVTKARRFNPVIVSSRVFFRPVVPVFAGAGGSRLLLTLATVIGVVYRIFGSDFRRWLGIDATVHPRDVKDARALRNSCPSIKRAQGMPGASAHPQPRMQR